MSKWKRTLDVSSFYHDDSLTVPEKGVLMCETLKKMFPNYNDVEKYGFEFPDIVERFENVTGFEDTTEEEEFNIIMNELYDWCDGEKIWVETK